MANRKSVIGVMGGHKVSQKVMEDAKTLGRLIAENGWVLLNGGRNKGVMAASAKGAKAADGTVIGVLPDKTATQASPDLDYVILTNMGDARNIINVLSSDVVIVCRGASGTLTEIFHAVNAKKPVILLNFELGHELIHKLSRRLPGARLFAASTPQQAIELADEILRNPNLKQHPLGIR